MINAKEALVLILSIIILAFSNSFLGTTEYTTSLVYFTIIILIYVFAKKLTASYWQAEEETKIWTFQRFGVYERSYFRKPIPIGIILPFLLSILSLGFIKWFAVTESEIRPLPERAARRHQKYSYSEINEWDTAVIASAGIIACLIFSIVCSIINQPEIGKLFIYFATFNLLPIGKLDGTKVLFGDGYALYWIILAIIDILMLSLSFVIF